MHDEAMHDAMPTTLPFGFVASETSTSDELELAAWHCAQTGQVLVINSDKALTLAEDLGARYSDLKVRVDVGAWRRDVASPDEPLADVDNLFGISGWYEQHVPVGGRFEGYTPSKFITADDRDSRRSLLEQTSDAPENIVTRIATDASVLGAKRRDEFFEDLSQTRRRRFGFVFAAKRDPLANYQTLVGLRRLLEEFPGSEIDHIDPLVAADALSWGAGWVGVGASGSRRMPMRPGDSGGPPAVGWLPGLFLEDLMELRSPMIYADWFANVRSPYCNTCDRALDLFEQTAHDRAAIVRHNLHQVSSYINSMWALPPEERRAYLRKSRLQAHARHLVISSVGMPMNLNRSLQELLQLDDPEMRTMTRAGVWK